MEIQNQIKNYRKELGLSQEDLAEKLFVTRQTVSNWETAKSYPDIHSLITMSALFNISLDQLIKGDVNIMKETLENNNYSNSFKAIKYLAIITFIIFEIVYFITSNNQSLEYLYILPLILSSIMLYIAIQLEILKKQKGFKQYIEIVAFIEGLDNNSKDSKSIEKELKQKNLIFTVAFLVAGFIFASSIFNIISNF